MADDAEQHSVEGKMGRCVDCKHWKRNVVEPCPWDDEGDVLVNDRQCSIRDMKTVPETWGQCQAIKHGSLNF